MPNIILRNAQSTQNLGYLLGKYLPPGSTILLLGDLGAGKTTLVQGIGKGLNISESIVSPTFTLINEYLDGRLPLYHLDLYRLEPNQVDAIYPEIYWEGVEVTPGITAIEWSQRLPTKPPSYLEIQLNTHLEARQICIKHYGTSNYDLKFIGNFAELAPE